MKRLIPLLVLVLVLTACKVRLDVALVINEDETGTIEFAVSMDQEIRDLLSQSGNDQLPIADSLPEGWVSEEFVDGGFEGARAIAAFSSLDDFGSLLNVVTGGVLGENSAASTDVFSQLQLARDGDLYNFSVDLTGLEASLRAALGGAAGDTGGLDSSVFLSELIDMRIVLTMPGEIVSSNADATAESTLTWNLSVRDDGKTLMAQSIVAIPIGPNVVVPVVAVALSVAAALIVIRRRSTQRKAEIDMTNGSPLGSLCTDPSRG